jgi:hypothetical protein
MFRRLRAHANPAGKTKIHLNDMRLTNVPPNQCLIFLKCKQGRTGFESRKYPILGNTVIFAEPLIFDYEMPHDLRAHHPKPLRLSFRMENPSSSGFTRYGIAEFDVMQCIVDSEFELHLLLSDCAYNTYFRATLVLPEGSPFPTITAKVAAIQATTPASLPLMRKKIESPAVKSSEVSSSSSYSNRLFETAPVRVSREKFDQLEKQVDLMLAGIINAGDDRTM